MRTWVKATIGGVVLIAMALVALTATGAYFVFRHMEQRTAGEAEAIKEIDVVKARFGARQPLVQISDPMKADIRINRSTEASAAPVDSILTVSDIQRYGPGIVVDYGGAGDVPRARVGRMSADDVRIDLDRALRTVAEV